MIIIPIQSRLGNKTASNEGFVDEDAGKASVHRSPVLSIPQVTDGCPLPCDIARLAALWSRCGVNCTY